MTNNELIKAPIDNKNVMQDWIEEVFDGQNCVWGKGSAVGYIYNEPVLAAWSDNMLLWQFILDNSIEDTNHLAVLKDRLNAHHDPDGSLVEKFTVIGNILMQQFYWKED